MKAGPTAWRAGEEAGRDAQTRGPRPRRVRMTAPLALCLCACLASLSCGASDDSAPQLDAGPTCKTIDDHLAPLRARVETGGMEQIARILDEMLDPASLQAIVQLLLDIGRDLPPGTPERLTALMEHPQGKRLIPVLVALLRPLPGDPDSAPPLPPKDDEMKAFSRIARTCLSGPLFAQLTALMRDPRLAPILEELLGAVDLATELRSALVQGGYDGKAGFVLLIRNVGLSMAAPGFDPTSLVDALDALAGDDPGVLGALRDLLVVLTRDASGEPMTARVAVVSTAVGCFLKMDPQLVLPAYWYDVLLSPEVSSALGGRDPKAPPWDVAPLMELMDLAAYATDALARSEAARDALGQVLGLLLRPDLAVKGIPEVVALLEGDIIPGAVAMLADLIEKPCLQADG